MNWWEYLAGSLIMVSCIMVIVITLFQDKKINQNMDAIQGGQSNADSFYGKNEGRTREAYLRKVTAVCIFITFALTVTGTVISAYFQNK